MLHTYWFGWHLFAWCNVSRINQSTTAGTRRITSQEYLILGAQETSTDCAMNNFYYFSLPELFSG